VKKGLIYVDVEKCRACKSCEIACAVEHSKSKQIIEILNAKEQPKKRRRVLGSKGAVISIACQNCRLAPCITACMAGAMFKNDEGHTLHDEEKCVGCCMCMMVCPFGVISRDGHIVLKCDLCPDKKDGYACVAACPSGALFAGTEDEFRKRLGEKKKKEVKK